MNTDPFLHLNNSYKRLYSEYVKHKSLVIALDFDNTIFDYHKLGYEFPLVVNLIKECKENNFKVVIFSGSAKERHPFIREYCQNLGIEIDGINEDVIDWHKDKNLDWTNSKIYYNIFLDDRAGLRESYQTLRLLIDCIKNEKVNNI